MPTQLIRPKVQKRPHQPPKATSQASVPPSGKSEGGAATAAGIASGWRSVDGSGDGGDGVPFSRSASTALKLRDVRRDEVEDLGEDGRGCSAEWGSTLVFSSIIVDLLFFLLFPPSLDSTDLYNR